MQSLSVLLLLGVLLGAIAFARPDWLPALVLAVAGLILLGMLRQSVDRTLAALLAPAQALQDLREVFDRAAAGIWGLIERVRRERGLSEPGHLVQRTIGALLHLGFAALVIAAELWLIAESLAAVGFEEVAGLVDQAWLRPSGSPLVWAIALAPVMFLSVLPDLAGWSHLGPWSTAAHPRLKRAVAAIALVGALLALTLYLGMANLRSAAINSGVPDTLSVGSVAPGAGQPSAGILAESLPTTEQSDAELSTFEVQGKTLVWLVFGTMVGVLFLSCVPALMALADALLLLGLLLAGVLCLLLLVCAWATGWLMRPFYWLAVLMQALGDLVLHLAELLATPLTALLPRKTGTGAVPALGPVPALLPGTSIRAETDTAPAPVTGPQAPPALSSNEPDPDGASRVPVSHNWRPFN